MSTTRHQLPTSSSLGFALPLCTALVLFSLAFASTPALAWEVDLGYRPTQIEPPWASDEAWLIEALSEGVVLRTEPIGTGITNPFKAELEYQDQRLQAIWKPLRTNDFTVHESYPAEVAAYRLSKHLGLNMVPPTVKRKVGRRWGSLQLWVNGHSTYADVVATRPFDFERSDQVQLMRFFDALIDNPDRNAGNFLVDERFRVVLIDHSRAMNFGATERQREGSMPIRFQASVVERLRLSDISVLEALLGDLVTRGDLKSLNLSARRLLKFVENELATHGPSIMFTHPRPAGEPALTMTQNSRGSTLEP